jgi:RimJ/RimL family protein N-acetyltransferase
MVGTNCESPEGLQIGYCINIAYLGRGYASEGLAAFLKLFWALDERRNFSFLVGRADPENLASTRVLQKFGARKGILLKGIWKRNGEEHERDLQCWNIDRPAIVEDKSENKDDETDSTKSRAST